MLKFGCTLHRTVGGGGYSSVLFKIYFSSEIAYQLTSSMAEKMMNNIINYEQQHQQQHQTVEHHSFNKSSQKTQIQ